MKYILRIIVSIPMMALGLSMIAFLIYGIYYHWSLILVTIGEFFVFQLYASNFEEIVQSLATFIRKLADSTLIYK